MIRGAAGSLRGLANAAQFRAQQESRTSPGPGMGCEHCGIVKWMLAGVQAHSDMQRRQQSTTSSMIAV